MGLFEQITEAYPELTWIDFRPGGLIQLQNDSDGLGDYIAEWNYSKPIPKDLTVGKPKK